MVRSSRGEPTATFYDIPQELLDRICKSVDLNTLKTLRLVDNTLEASATKLLFSQCEVRPSEESVARCMNIVAAPNLRGLVSSVTFHTSDNPTANHYNTYNGADFEEWREEALPLDSFCTALASIGKFRKLRSVELKFAENCMGGSNQFAEGPETFWFRMRVMRSLVKGLTSTGKSPSRVHRLIIKNLQDKFDSKIVPKKDWSSILSKIDDLALQIASETDDAAPECEMGLEEIHEFYNTQLRQHILEPVAPKLRSLKLYGRQHAWGYYPHIDLRTLKFPHLESLALGQFTFVHDWQFDWICSHSDLKSLILEDCPIIHAGKTSSYDMTFEHVDPQPTEPDEDDNLCWYYKRRWYTSLRRFSRELTKLRHFGFGSVARHEYDQVSGQELDLTFERAEELGVELRRDRYVIFDAGTGPSPLCGPDDRGREVVWTYSSEEEMAGDDHREEETERVERGYGACWEDAPLPPKCDKEDIQALKELMRAVLSRR